MKIVTTIANDFIRSEVNEWGWEYVDSKFDEGYEPMLVNGVWVWATPVPVSSTLDTNTIGAANRKSSTTVLSRL